MGILYVGPLYTIVAGRGASKVMPRENEAWPNVVLMVGQRPRRWASIETLGRSLVSDLLRVTLSSAARQDD